MHLSYSPSGNNRIEIADVLRGFAVLGITLIHFIERFSLYSYPEETCNLLLFTDKVIWDSVFFAFSGKAYCIFALLFGFSFFVYSGETEPPFWSKQNQYKALRRKHKYNFKIFSRSGNCFWKSRASTNSNRSSAISNDRNNSYL